MDGASAAVRPRSPTNSAAPPVVPSKPLSVLPREPSGAFGSAYGTFLEGVLFCGGDFPGESVGFRQQVCEQIPHLRRFARALCRDPVAADDLVQDCLERALSRRHLWRPHGRLRSWLFRILYRIHLNERTSARARREVDEPVAGEPLSVAPSQDVLAQVGDVLDAVDELPLEQRAALLLMVLEGPSYRDAALILDVNVGTLRSRLARARETVRRRCQRERPASERRLRRVK